MKIVCHPTIDLLFRQILRFLTVTLLFTALTTINAQELAEQTGGKQSVQAEKGGQEQNTRKGDYHPGSITIASEPDYPPFCMVDNNGNPMGFSVDLFNAAAAAVGIEVRIDIGIWNHIKQDLSEGKIDALPLVGRTPERENTYDFTMPYISLHGAAFVRKGRTNINSIADLKDKEIMVMKGDNAEEYLIREGITDHIFTANTYEEALRLLASGAHDAVIMQRMVGINLLEELEIKSVVPLGMHLPGLRQDFCFAVQEGNDSLLTLLNEGLSVIIANNTYEVIRNSWFGPIIEEKASFRDIRNIVLITIIPIILLMSIIWIILLRKEVKRRTKRLNKEVLEHKETLEELKSKQLLLKEREEHIRLLLNSTAEGIYGLDIDGNCTFINNAAINVLGYKNEDSLLGKNMHDLIHHTKTDGTKCSREECNIYRASKSGQGTHSDTEILWRKNGTSFPSEYFSYPIRRNEVVIGSVVTFWDITKRKKTESELKEYKETLELQVIDRTAELNEKIMKLDKSQKAMLYMVEDLNNVTSELKRERKKLEISNRELEAFTYSVSHDLRAPLRAINGFSRFLSEDYADKLDEEGKRFIDTIRTNATKMDDLISDLLNLSRVSRGALTMSEVDMGLLAASMYQEMADNEMKKTFTLIINETPLVKCDSGLLKQVWQNLIDNALKYSAKSERKEIIIGAEKNENEITFFIKDFGAGFNEKYLNKIFGLFQRLHREDEFEGTGVGLAIVQRIIHRHGGRVWAEGAVGQGASFYFTLPTTINNPNEQY